MAVGTASPPLWTLADLLEQFGPIPAHRIRSNPPPGLATEQDVLEIHARERRLYELVDGVLVEKDMGFYESYLSTHLAHNLYRHVLPRNLGIIVGADGMMRLAAGLVRIPDVAFIAWDRLPNRQVPRDPIPDLVPDLAVEIWSAGNTKAEMARKLREYFEAGVRLVWYVDPNACTVTVYTGPDQGQVLTREQTLDGGAVLPGFTLSLREFFTPTESRPGS